MKGTTLLGSLSRILCSLRDLAAEDFRFTTDQKSLAHPPDEPNGNLLHKQRDPFPHSTTSKSRQVRQVGGDGTSLRERSTSSTMFSSLMSDRDSVSITGQWQRGVNPQTYKVSVLEAARKCRNGSLR